MTSERREFDKFLSRWIAAESIYHLKETSYWNKLKWISKLKVHKIIFNVAEKFDLPITRSWYLHGGYIHDYDDLDKNFSGLASNYIRSKKGPIRYRSKIKKTYPNIDDIIDYIKITSSEINSYKVDDYLLYLYNNEAPKEYKNCYLSKYNFSNENSKIELLSKLSSSHVSAVPYVKNLIDKIYDEVTDYDIHIYNTFNDEILEKNSRYFFNLLEDILRKSEIIINSEDVIPKQFFKIITDFTSYFVYDIWRPYACIITNNTVVGPWSENVKKINVKNWRTAALENFKIHVKSLEHDINKYNLKTSYTEMNNYNIYKKDKTMNDIISLLNNYEKKKE